MPRYSQRIFTLNEDKTSFFSLTSPDLTRLISSLDYDTDPNNEISIALRHAASGTEADIEALVKMVETNPELLSQEGDVVTRGGVPVRRIKLYEFFLGECDPYGAEKIEFGFKKMQDGEEERKRQYKRYQPHIQALAKQSQEKNPAYDLGPLIETIKNGSDADINEALNLSDSNRSETRNTPLRIELAKFRRAVQPKIKMSGEMHYEHYTTLLQALNLLHDEWKAFSNNYINHEKCDLIWRQVIGYLQRSLPAVDRFAFAHGFHDAKRDAKYKYDPSSFPDISFDRENFSNLGFDNAIFALQRPTIAGVSRLANWAATSLECAWQKRITALQNLGRISSPQLNR